MAKSNAQLLKEFLDVRQRWEATRPTPEYKRKKESGGGKKQLGMLYKQPVYRYKEGAKPGDEKRVLPDSSGVLRTLGESEFPTKGSLRFDWDPQSNNIYRLHDGSVSPLSKEGKPRYGYTADEMEAFFNHQQRQREVTEKQFERINRGRQKRFNEERKKQEAARKEMDPAERQSELISNIAESSGTGTGVLAGILSKQLSKDKSITNRVLDLLSRPLYAAVGQVDQTIENFQKGRPAMYGRGEQLIKNITGKEKTAAGTVLQDRFNVKGGAGFAGGLAGDILLDPLTYTPAVLFTAPAKALQSTARAGTRALSSAGRSALGRTAPDVGESILRRSAPDVSKGITNLYDDAVRPSMLSDLVRSDIPQAKKFESAENLIRAASRPIANRRAEEYVNEGVNNLYKSGDLTADEVSRLNRAYSTPDFDKTVQQIVANKAPGPQPKTPPGTPAPGSVVPSRRTEAPRPLLAGARQVASETRRLAQSSAAKTTKARASAIAAGDKKLPMKAPVVKNPLRAVSANARTTLREGKDAAALMFKTSEHVATRAADMAKQTDNFVSGRRGSLQATKGLSQLTAIANDNAWWQKFSQVFGERMNPIQDEMRSLVDDYISEVGRRPIVAGDTPALRDQALRDNAAWHAGLFSSIGELYEGRNLDLIAEQTVRQLIDSGDANSLRQLESLGESTEELVSEARQAVSPTTLEAWEQAVSRSEKVTPEAFTKLTTEAKQVAAQAEEAVKTQMYEIIATSDQLPLPENVRFDITPEGRLETNLTPEKWDEFIQERSNVQIPQLAAKSYNDVFSKIAMEVSAKYGQSRAMEEFARRQLGGAQARVASAKGFLTSSPIARVPRRQRKKDFKEFRDNGVMSDTMRELIRQMDEEILPVYSDTDRFATAFGQAGQPNLGDLNRWLNQSNFKFAIEKNLPKGGKVYDNDWLTNLPENTDPLEYLWQVHIANEKVLTEKATLVSIADGFGVRNTNVLANEALRKSGYVENQHFGDQVIFHPEVSRQVDRLYDLTHRAEQLHPFLNGLSKVTSLWRRVLTIYNPGFHTRQVIGDSFKNYGAEGVSPLSSISAINLMKRVKAIDPQVRKMIESPSQSMEEILEGASDASRNFLKLPSGDYLSAEEIYGSYVRSGLSSTQVSTGTGIAERMPGGRVARAGIEIPEKLADATATFGRMSLYIDQLKKGKSFEEAARSVRKVHYDYNYLTPFEKATLSNVIPFYRYLRNNYPYMASILFTKPGRATIPDKIQRNFSMNRDEDYTMKEGMPWGGFLPPEWVLDRRMWPIADHGNTVIYAAPDYELNSWLSNFGKADPESVALTQSNQLSPGIWALYQSLTGKELMFDELQDSSEGHNPLQNFLTSIPQLEAGKNIQQGELSDPGRVGQIAGLGSTTVFPDDAVSAAFQQLPILEELSASNKQQAIKNKEKYEQTQKEIQGTVRGKDEQLAELIRLIRGE